MQLGGKSGAPPSPASASSPPEAPPEATWEVPPPALLAPAAEVAGVPVLPGVDEDAPGADVAGPEAPPSEAPEPDEPGREAEELRAEVLPPPVEVEARLDALDAEVAAGPELGGRLEPEELELPPPPGAMMVQVSMMAPWVQA